ncbi:hypothetical protein C5Y96_13065 [Blastopirellula marina]|uniref:Uncharacterized protein n=1 Tax=Blastopirellula marina TaxID=124 RepID=A0A2S8FGH7_9BACT|nr:MULTISPECIES: hypothetical protein [Pirellulaceae]PQO31269.1 hypothetical protein C5Y96_13065 [Blastopirellula marina]RCS51663.1 hypothetical protein DTL36_13075 [Bremerella cremea]
MEASPYQSPTITDSFTLPKNPGKVKRVAKFQKWVIVAMFGNAILYIVAVVLGLLMAWTHGAAASEEIPPIYETLISMLTVVEPFVVIFSFVASFTMARQFFNRPLSFLIMFLGAFPFICLPVLLLQNLQGARYLNRQGIAAGFFGTNLEKLHALIAQAEAEA